MERWPRKTDQRQERVASRGRMLLPVSRRSTDVSSGKKLLFPDALRMRNSREYIPRAGLAYSGRRWFRPKICCPPALTQLTREAHIRGAPSLAAKPCTSISSPSFKVSFLQPFLYKPFGGGVSAPQLTTLPS